MSHNSWFLEKKPLSLYPAELTAGLFGGANLFNGAALASVSLIVTPYTQPVLQKDQSRSREIRISRDSKQKCKECLQGRK